MPTSNPRNKRTEPTRASDRRETGRGAKVIGNSLTPPRRDYVMPIQPLNEISGQPRLVPSKDRDRRPSGASLEPSVNGPFIAPGEDTTLVRAAQSELRAKRRHASTGIDGMCIMPNGPEGERRDWGTHCHCMCSRCWLPVRTPTVMTGRCICSHCPCPKSFWR